MDVSGCLDKADFIQAAFDALRTADAVAGQRGAVARPAASRRTPGLTTRPHVERPCHGRGPAPLKMKPLIFAIYFLPLPRLSLVLHRSLCFSS